MTSLAAIRKSPLVTDGARVAEDLELSADVCVIGSGAGGAVVASVLAEAGVGVLVVEEGGWFSEADFTMRELDVAPKLYQEAMLRTTADGAIAVLQGRAVGGTTVVNWTTSFRTPEPVLACWATKHEVKGFVHADLVPHWEAIERRLSIHQVDVASLNANNRKLWDGCKALGWEVDTLRRNVTGCMQSGACGMGCPVNAKRSMLVTLIPDAVEAGARVLHRCRIDRLEARGGEIAVAHGTLLDADGHAPTGRRVRVHARRFVVAGGAINSPALLIRSGLDGKGLVGRRTFLHPVIGSAGVWDERIAAFTGAPQSAASHHFADREAKVGLFLETAPSYPMLAATAMPGFGPLHARAMERFAHIGMHLAIAIDGFHDDVPGGTVRVRPSGAPVLDYPIPDALWEAFRFGQKRLAELQLAAGAREVWTLHDPSLTIRSTSDLERVDAAPWRAGNVGVFTAHQMGGCAMSDDPRRGVVRSSDLRHHEVANLWVIDGSVFPTSLGVNPQESIYGLARLMATRLVPVAKG